MLDFKVVRPVEKTQEGLWRACLKHPDLEMINFCFNNLWAGFSWPKPLAPGYGVIFAEMFDKNAPKEAPGQIKMLCEFKTEDFSFQTFCEKIAEISHQFGLFKWCCDMSESESENIEGFRNILAKKDMRYIQLLPGLYVDNHVLGVSIIKDLLTANILSLHDKSILKDQLTRFTKNDLERTREQFESEFFAIHGSRFPLAVAFQRRLKTKTPKGRQRVNLGPNAWMAG